MRGLLTQVRSRSKSRSGRRAAEPDRHRVGHVRARRRGRPPRRPARARRGHGEVGVPVSRGQGKPRAAVAHDRGGDVERGRSAGPGRRRVGRARSARACARPARASIASVWGHTVDDFAAAAELLQPAVDDLVAIEVNVSCPNLHIVRRSSRTIPRPPRVSCGPSCACGLGLPVFAKLSPNVTDLTLIARAAVDAGATGLTLVNTVLGLLDRRRDPPAGPRRWRRRPVRSRDQAGRAARGARRHARAPRASP